MVGGAEGIVIKIYVASLVLLCASNGKFANSQSLSMIPEDVTLPLQTLIEQGSRGYYSNDWVEAIDKFEKAVINYRMRSYVDVNCNVKCKDTAISSELGIDMNGFDDLRYFGDVLAQANCVKLCEEEHPYGKTISDLPELDILDGLENKKPYNFLQYAYYQTNKLEKACKAAQTYYNSNLDDEQAKENIDFYRSMEEVDQSYFEDLEAPKFHKKFGEAIKAYEHKNYEEAVLKFEQVLAEFFSAFDDCQALCVNKPHEQTHFYRLHKATAIRLFETLDCCSECEKKLSPIFSNGKLSNFVATCLSYLQFSYFSIGRVDEAVFAAVSASLLNPNDDTSRHNMRYYESIKEEHQLSEADFNPRDDAKKFYLRREALKDLLIIRNTFGDQDDEMEVPQDHEVEISLLSDLTNRVAAVLDESIRRKLDNLD